MVPAAKISSARLLWTISLVVSVALLTTTIALSITAPERMIGLTAGLTHPFDDQDAWTYAVTPTIALAFCLYLVSSRVGVKRSVEDGAWPLQMDRGLSLLYHGGNAATFLTMACSAAICLAHQTVVVLPLAFGFAAVIVIALVNAWIAHRIYRLP